MSDIDISEPLSDMLAPLNNEQKEFLMNNYTIQTYKKNETIYCEGETPHHLMCLISGKVKIFKDGVGGRSQIIRMIKPRFCNCRSSFRTFRCLPDSYECHHYAGCPK